MNNNTSLQSVEEALQQKKQELGDLDAEIKKLHQRAEGHKPVIQEYNRLKQEEHNLKKLRAQKKRELSTVINFFRTINDHFLDNIFPLFANHQTEEKGVSENG